MPDIRKPTLWRVLGALAVILALARLATLQRQIGFLRWATTVLWWPWLTVIAAAAIGGWFVAIWPRHAAAGYELAGKDLFEARNEARKTVLQVVGAIAVASGLLVTYSDVQSDRTLAQNRLVTDTYTRAVGQLGTADRLSADGTTVVSNNLAVRLGGIYALDRIAEDDARYQEEIAGLLSAYVRTHLPHTPITNTVVAASDSQAIMEILGDGLGAIELRATERTAQSLSPGIDVRGAFLAGIALFAADFTASGFDRANLRAASLTHSAFDSSSLDGVVLADANLRGSSFVHASMRGATLTRARMDSVALDGADLTDADLTGARLYRVSGFDSTTLNRTIFVANEGVPSGFDSLEGFYEWAREQGAIVIDGAPK